MGLNQTPLRLFFATVLVLLAGEFARAGIVASESFEYGDGHLGDQNGGFGWTIPWYTASNPDGGWEVVSGQAVSAFVPYSSYCGRSFNNPATAPALFIAFELRTATTVDINDTIAVYGGNLSSYSIVMGKAPGTSDFAVVGSSLVATGIVVNPNTTYRVIGVYDVDNHRVAIWINPDGADYYNPATGENSADAMQTVNPGPIGSLLLTAYGPDGRQKDGLRFDNFVIADAPGDVGLLTAPPATPCACVGDMNVDGVKDGMDIPRFVSCLINGGDCRCADMDGVGGVAIGDIELFVADLLAAQPCLASCDDAARCQFPSHVFTLYIAHGRPIADDFLVTVAGDITQACWAGVYADLENNLVCGAAEVDDFRIVYFEADGLNGRPRTVRAGPFGQSAGTLTASRVATGLIVNGSAEYQFQASHAAVAVAAGECLWIEIANLTSGSCLWFREGAAAGNNRAYAHLSGGSYPYENASLLAADFSFCIGPAPVEIAPGSCGP